MKSRRKHLDKEAKKLTGLPEVRIYECHDGYHPKDHYYGVVWRGKQRWSIPVPWDANKNALCQVGLSLRYRANMDEQFEKVMKYSEEAEAEEKRDDANDKDQMVKECVRTVEKKPLYFYDK